MTPPTANFLSRYGTYVVPAALKAKDPAAYLKLQQALKAKSIADLRGVSSDKIVAAACTSADGLTELGHKVSYRTVARLLRALGYSLQANAKTAGGRQHPDRDAQFGYIAGQAKEFLAGYYAVDCETLERAQELAAMIPDAALTAIEVRPVMADSGLEM